MGLLIRRKLIADTAQINWNQKANILLCSDKNVLRGLGVTVVSVLENISMSCAIHIAFNGELPGEEEERFKVLSDHYHVPICFYWIDDSALQSLQSNSYITITAYYRLLMPYILDDFGIERCLYLDTDILCVHDIADWYVQNLTGQIGYVTKDATSQPKLRENVTCETIGMRGRQYFNSGILLLNIAEYVKHDIGKKAVQLQANHSYDNMDQDVLNIAMESQVIFDSSYAYNCGMSVRNNELPDTIYLIHFTGAKKPWKLCVSEVQEGYGGFHDLHTWKYKYYRIWRTYCAQSPWAGIPFDLPKSYREWRYLSAMYFKSGKMRASIWSYIQYLKYKSEAKRK